MRLFDTNELNPTRLDWNVNTSSYSPTAEVGAPGTGELFVNEFGYKQDATPSSLYTWGRLGVMYNNSTFHDFTKSVADGGLIAGRDRSDERRKRWLLLAGGSATLAIGARLSQQRLRRGLYAGATIMYARPQTTPITQYYEGRSVHEGSFCVPAERPRVAGCLTIKSTALIWSTTSTHLMPSGHTESPKHGRRPWVTWRVLDPEFPSPLASTTRRILHRHFTLVLRRQTHRSASKGMH